MRTPGRTSTGAEPWKGLASGLIGGLAGSLAMAAVQWALSSARGGGPRPALDAVAGDAGLSDRGTSRSGPGRPSTVEAVQLGVRAATGRELPEASEEAAGRAFHFAFGTAMGGAYGLLVEYYAPASIGEGLPFGALQVLLADESSVPALGLSESPKDASMAAHASSLAAHAGYGLATEWVRRRVRARL